MAPKRGAPTDLTQRNKFEPNAFVDVLWACLFVILVSVITGYVVYVCSSNELSWAIQTLSSEDTVNLLQGHFAKDSGAEYISVVLITASLFISAAYACVWMTLLQTYPEPMVTGSLYLFAILLFFLGVIDFAAGDIIGGSIILLIATICLCVPICLRAQLRFTAQIVKGVSAVYSGQRSIFVVAFLCVLLQICWIGICTTSMIPAVAYSAEDKRKSDRAKAAGEDPPPSSGGAAALLFLMVSFYWGIQVFSNLLNVSCSGVIARYYFNKQVDNAVYMSTSQAFTSYLGPVALGSLLVAIIQTLKHMAESLANKREGGGRRNGAEAVLACVAVCCLGCLERLVEIFNEFCFIITAIYGTSFCESGSEVINLFSRGNGFRMINAWNFAGLVCFMGNLFGAILVAGIVALLAAVLVAEESVGAYAAFASISGFAIMMVVSRVVESGCNTLIVCYVEEPNKVESSADEIHEALVTMGERRSVNEELDQMGSMGRD